MDLLRTNGRILKPDRNMYRQHGGRFSRPHGRTRGIPVIPVSLPPPPAGRNLTAFIFFKIDYRGLTPQSPTRKCDMK
jgi:hypothetical protein